MSNDRLKFRARMYSPSRGYFWAYSGDNLPGFFKECEGENIDQWTGLCDSDGVEIFEGDIIRVLYTDWPSQPAERNGQYSMSLEDYKKSISVIRVVDYCAPKYSAKNMKTDDCGSLNPGEHGEIEVIGNIHENPELVGNA